MAMSLHPHHRWKMTVLRQHPAGVADVAEVTVANAAVRAEASAVTGQDSIEGENGVVSGVIGVATAVNALDDFLTTLQ